MPHSSGYRNQGRKQQQQHQRSKGITGLDEHNPILKAFRGYASELDAKHDRHERLVKLSRDTTIEAKRIIFLLHTIDERKNNKAKILEEAEQRLNKVIDVNLRAVAKELIGQDYYQYRSAYSPGLQEFIEAYSFMEYMKNVGGVEAGGSAPLSSWLALQEKMQYVDQRRILDPPEEQNTGAATNDERSLDRRYGFFIDPTEYILGISDLTGELMRRCINSLGSGEIGACLATCKVLQHFYTGFISINAQRCRELSRKVYTIRQSVLKAERVCYNVKVRGGEAAKWGAVYDNKPNDDIDEGFF